MVGVFADKEEGGCPPGSLMLLLCFVRKLRRTMLTHQIDTEKVWAGTTGCVTGAARGAARGSGCRGVIGVR